MPDVDHYDFFVSYARSDNANGWISNFVEELLAEHRKFAAGRDLTYFFDKHEIGAGADWQHTLNHGIAHSKLFVAFISPNYFASEWCRKEWRAWIDAEIAKHILTAGVRPVYIVEVPGLTDGKLSDHDFAKQIADFLKISEGDRVKLLAETPPVVKHLRRRQMTHNQPFCDVHSFYTEGVETLRRDDLRQVLSKLAQDLEHHAVLLAKADASITTIPPYNRNFSGRLDELLQLREWLDKDDRTGVIHGVHGLGGIGKTELALTYAHGYASAYPGGRFLIQCDGKTSLREAILTQHDFTSLFADKISDELRKDPAEYFAAIQRHLSHRLESLGHVLLLLDNVTDTALLTREQADALTRLGPKLHLLATTRLPAPPTHKDNWISLDRLPEEDALELLEKHRPFKDDEDREAAWQIVKRLDGFTLAVELTAAYLAANESVSYAKMAAFLELDELEEMANDSGVELIRHNHERRLSAVLGPVLESLNPVERLALEYAAVLPGEHVPLAWLKKLVSLSFADVEKEGRLKNPWDEVWQSLEKLSLFSRADDNVPDQRLVRVHRLVRKLVDKRINNNESMDRMTDVFALASDRIDALMHSDQLEFPKWELKTFNSIALGLIDLGNVSEGIKLQKYLGDRWYLLGEWLEAEDSLRNALTSAEKLYGYASLEIVEYLDGLANLLRVICRYDEAAELLNRALNICEKQLEPNHINNVPTLVSLSALFQSINNLHEAERFSSRALEINKQFYGLKDYSNAVIYNNHAVLLKTLGRLEESEQFYRDALELLEDKYGINSYVIVRYINNLADVLVASGNFDEAEELYQRALRIKNNSESRDSDIATSLDGLAALLRNTNRSKEAEPFIRESLSIREKIYGLDHPDVATSLNNLGLMLYEIGRYHEAEPLFRRGLAIYEAQYGPDHTEVAASLCNLGLLLTAMGRLGEAEQHYLRALEIFEHRLGSDHSLVESTLNSIVWLLWETSRFAESEPFFRRMLTFYQKKQVEYYQTLAAWFSKIDALPLPERTIKIVKFMKIAYLSQKNTPVVN